MNKLQDVLTLQKAASLVVNDLRFKQSLFALHRSIIIIVFIISGIIIIIIVI